MTMTLRHLARDVSKELRRDVDPYRIRGILRMKFGRVSGRRWRWPSDTDNDYKRKRRIVLKELAHERHTGINRIEPHRAGFGK